MAIMGTFSSFTTARLAIYASQASLNVTGNNISNINTAGYTRQRMDLVSLYSTGAGKYKSIYNTNVGYGVMAKGVTQLRDPYLDIRYRNESAKLGDNSEKLDGLTQMSRILDEVGKGTGEKEGFGVIEAQFGSLYKALQNLEVNVGSPEYDDLVRTEADVLATYFNKASQDLKDIQDIKSKQIYEYAADINNLLTNIRDLNEQIRTQSIYGDSALELRDARNMSLDKLSEYLHINVEYSMERIDQFSEVEKLTVTLAGSRGYDGNPIKLVDGIFGGQISFPENMPLVNPDYDPMAINRAKEETRRAAEEEYPLSRWQAGIDAQLAEERKSIEAANAADQEPWATKIKTAIQEALDALPGNATDEEKTAAEEAARAAVEETRKDTIEAAVAKKEQELWRDWKPGIDKQMAEERRSIEAANAADREPWATEIKTAVQKAIDALPDNATAAEKNAAAEAAKAAVEKTRTETIEAAVTEKEQELRKIWKAGIDAQMTEERKSIEDANTADQEYWVKAVETAVQRALNALPYNATEEDKRAAEEGAKAAVENTRLKTIETAVAEREQELWRAARIQRQGIVDDAVQKTEDAMVEAGGKYVKTQAKPNAKPPVAAKYTNNVEEAITYPNDKFLIQIEPLKDRRDRVMTDSHTVSKESEVMELDDVILYGKFQAIREMLTEEGEYASQKDIDMDPNAALKRGIPYYQKALDSLAKKVAEIFNEANQLPAKDVYQSKNGVFVGEDGAPVKDEKGKLVTVDRIDKAVTEADKAVCLEAIRRSGCKNPLYEFYDGGVLFSNNGNNNDPSGITAANITVSAAWANGSVRVLNDKRPDTYAADGKTVIKHSSRNDNIRHIISMFDKQLDYYATDVQPDTAAKLPVLRGSFREVFTAISGTLADDAQATTGKVDSYTITTLNLENDRQSVSGVDLNEEATSMMQFSKSYSAACRLLTTIDEMLDKLINGTAL